MFMRSLAKIILGSLLAQPSVDYMKALGVGPASVFGLQNYVCTSTSIRNFAPHVPIPGIMLPFFYCKTSCCKFDIHVITLQGDIVKELHGVIDRHERVEALKWYYLRDNTPYLKWYHLRYGVLSLK